MDYQPVVDAFKEEYSKVGEIFNPTDLLFLFLELSKQGFTPEMVDVPFQKYLINSLFGEDEIGVKAWAVQYIKKYATSLVVTEEAKPVQVAKPEVKAAPAPAPAPKPVVKQSAPEYLSAENIRIPSEEEEGDGLYMPADQMIDLKEEDFAKMDIDWAFAERLGVVRSGK